MSKSSDIAFRLIALQKRLLGKRRLDEIMDQARRDGLSVEAVLLETGELSQHDMDRILRTRRRHGRTCGACAKTTYLLPGQNEGNTPCEFCGGRLEQGARSTSRRPRAFGESSGSHDALPTKPSSPVRAPRPKKKRPPTAARTLRPELQAPSPEPVEGHATIRDELSFDDAPDGGFRTTDSPYVGKSGSIAPGLPFGEDPPAPERVSGVAQRPANSFGGTLGNKAPQEPIMGDGFATTDSPFVGNPAQALPFGAGEEPPTMGDGFATTDSPYVKPGAALPFGAGEEPPAMGDGFATTDSPFVQPGGAGLPFGAGEEPPATGDGFATTDSPYVGGRPPAPEEEDELEEPFRTTDQPYVDPPRGPGPRRESRRGSGPDSAANDAHAGAAAGPEVPEQDDERARRLRLEGAGFGYAPEPEPDPEPEPEPEEPMPGPAGDGPHGGPEPPDDDARFRPPADHAAPLPLGVVAAQPRAPVPPLREEIGKILLLPLTSWQSVVLIVFGALLMLPRRFVHVIVAAMLVLLLFTYPATYLIRCTRQAFLGKEGLPDWPDFDVGELASNGLRLFAVQVASFIPLLLLLIALSMSGLGLVTAPKRVGNALKTIGSKAHLAAPKDPYIPPGTDCSEATFVSLKGEEIRLDQGRWTVVGLLGRDTADETGIDQAMVDMPTGGFGVAIMHGWQPYDLDRIGLALPEVRVLGAFADPHEKVIRQKYPFLDRDQSAAEEEPVEEEPVDEDPDGVEAAGLRDHRKEAVKDLHRAMDVAAIQGQIHAGKGPGVKTDAIEQNPFHTLEIVKTETLDFPGPLKDVKRLPCVYVIDPRGKLAREYATGVYDEKLYADLQSLMLGGSGDTFAKPLPAHVVAKAAQMDPTTETALYAFMLVLFVVGLVIYPMCYLLMVAFDSPTTPFLYPVGARAIAKALPDYGALVAILVALNLCSIAFMRLLGPRLETMLPGHAGPLLIDFIGFFLAFYSAVVAAYAIGRWYYANEQAIGWFSRGDTGEVVEAHEPDAPMVNRANPWG